MAYPLGYEDQLTSPAIGGMDAKSTYIQQAQYDKRYAAETQAAPSEAPITRLARAVDRLANTAVFAMTTSDLLCGCTPNNVSPGKDASSPDGLFAAINMLANRIEMHIDTIQSSMERIHKIGG